MATQVDVSVQRNGSGTVSVAVTLDRQAADRIGDLEAQLRVDDLRRAGWRISGPRRQRGGGLRVSASKAFARSDQAGAVLAEVAGRDGPLRGFTVGRSHTFASTSWHVAGMVDLRRGLAAFSDPRVTALLGGQPLGHTEEELLAAAGRPLAAAAPFRVRILLPGGRVRTYDARLGGAPVRIDTGATETKVRAYVLIGAGALCALLAVALVVIGRRRPRRPPHRERGMGTYVRQHYETISPAGRGSPPGAAGPRR